MKTSLDTIKDKITEEVVKYLKDIRYMTESERRQYIDSLRAAMKERKLLTTVRKQEGRTNSDDYNRTAFELYLDTLTTFSYVDNLYDTINTHQKLNRSIINTLKSTISGLNDRLDEVESVIGTHGAPQCHVEGFKTRNNQEWDKKYYTERYGEQVPLDAYARFNSEQENLTLDYTRRQNVMTYSNGIQLGEIKISKQYGVGFITARNSETKLENAIDNSMSSYWVDTVLADSEIKIVGTGYENSSGIGRSNRSYYDLPSGAMCEICLIFEAMAKVNELVLNPFGSFPIDIIAIRYALGDAEDDDIYDIISPGSSDAWLASQTINKEHAFHFPEITCKRLYILINQLHCIKDTFMMSTNQMFKNELWFNATYDEAADAKMPASTVFAPLYLDRALEDNVWTYINNKIVTGENIDINQMLISNVDKKLPVTKYQYTYGFYNIAPNLCEFQYAGVWVSDEIDAGVPIDTIRLKSEEEHFVASNGLISTDIEFYITTKKDPSYTDWIPICPYNKDYVYKERLQLDYDYCYLRHNAICTRVGAYNDDGEWVTVPERPIVYMDDTVLTENVDYILRYNDDGTAYAIEIAGIDFFALYTVSYTPADSSKQVSLIDSVPITGNTYEEIAGTGTSRYDLEGYPYYNNIDTSSVISHLRLINTVTGEMIMQTQQENSIIKCVTDKDHPAESYKNFIANTNEIQYYTYGKHLYFNRPISRDYKIEISYPSLDSKVRVKAILRRNTRRDPWMTPVLKGYTLEFTTV